MEDKFDIPDINEGYNTLFWWDYKDPGKEYEASRISRFYPYITWAKDHYFGRKNNPISNRDYPLTWEIKASHAEYKEMRIIDEQYWREEISAPHTWHAAEIFLYLLDI